MDALSPNYTNQRLSLADNLLKISRLLPDQLGHTPVSLIEGLYVIMENIDQGSIDEDSDDEFSVLTDKIAKDLKGLPLYYHIQALRQFTNLYFKDVLKSNPRFRHDARAKRVSEDLMKETMRSYKLIKKCLSPFEIIYLYTDGMITDRPIATRREEADFNTVLREYIGLQKETVLQYLSLYQKKLGEPLKKEAQQYAEEA